MAEHAVTLSITRLLTKRGAWWIKIHSSGIGRSGTPDLLAIYKGTPVVIEVKQPGRKPSPIQAYELHRAKQAGAHTVVATSAGQVAEILDAIQQAQDRGA